MSEARCQDKLKENVSCRNFAGVWFKFKPWLQRLSWGRSESSTCKGLFTIDRLSCHTWSTNTLWLPTVLYNEITATNGTGWATRNGLEALKDRFNWIWCRTESLKGAGSKRMRGNYLLRDGMLYRNSITKRRARSRKFLLHCSSNTSIKHLNLLLSWWIENIICDVINGCCRNTNSSLNWKKKKRQNFPFSAPPTRQLSQFLLHLVRIMFRFWIFYSFLQVFLVCVIKLCTKGWLPSKPLGVQQWDIRESTRSLCWEDCKQQNSSTGFPALDLGKGGFRQVWNPTRDNWL